MKAFATTDDLEARFRPLTDSEKERAGVLLEDARSLLTAEFNKVGVDIDHADELQASSLKIVSCSMVKRVLASDYTADVSQMSMTAGAYSQSFSYANPSGDMYLTKQERRVLGIPSRKQRIGSIPPSIHTEE